MQSTLQHQTVAATVVGRGITSTERVMTIDRGTQAGLAVGDSVLGQGGALVGQIYDIGPDYSRVLLLSDSRLTVTGMTQSTRATGEVVGQLGSTLAMVDISATATVVPDDLVVTAGIDLGNGFRSPFPKGLLIGRIVDLHTDPNAVVQSAVVDPAADLDALEFVLVITDYDASLPGASPAPAPPPGASASQPCARRASTGGNPPIDLPSPSLGPYRSGQRDDEPLAGFDVVGVGQPVGVHDGLDRDAEAGGDGGEDVAFLDDVDRARRARRGRAAARRRGRGRVGSDGARAGRRGGRRGRGRRGRGRGRGAAGRGHVDEAGDEERGTETDGGGEQQEQQHPADGAPGAAASGGLRHGRRSAATA